MIKINFNAFWILTLIFFINPTLKGAVYNPLNLGAKGDGIHDDTEAIQKAIDLASNNTTTGEVFIPAGLYLVKKTLKVNITRGLIIRGEGTGALSSGAKTSTTLSWGGKAGATLLDLTGNCGMILKDMAFLGYNKKEEKNKKLAGVLIQVNRPPNSGDMINHFSNLSLHSADIGIQMGNKASDFNCSDYYFEFITFANLGTGFKVKNDQGVDYLFNFIFACNVKDNVLHFERGGNLMVNNAQMTSCGRFLEINGGGMNTGVYQCNNVRVESNAGGARYRRLLLKSYPRHGMAVIRFTGFDDAQWNWRKNKSKVRNQPLCDIGPGSRVVFDSSILNSPVAMLNGTEKRPASLIIRSSSFVCLNPEESITANECGYFKTYDCMKYMSLIPDTYKWPDLKAKVLPLETPKESSN